MVILLAGATHSGKTVFAQKLLEKHLYPYLCIDHLKMGPIRSGHCSLSPESKDSELTEYLWPIVCEIIKTAIENKQNLIVKGCYIPFGFKNDFSPQYLQEIQYVCLILSESYIEANYQAIKEHANEVESRLHDTCLSKEMLLRENRNNLEVCKKHGLDYVLIDGKYEIDWSPRASCSGRSK